MAISQTALTLAVAARLAGVDKSTLRRAVKAGKISAVRDEQGVWRVEACEVERLYPLAPPEAQSPTAAAGALPRDALGDAPSEAERRTTDALIAELRSVISDLRGDRDHWRQQAQRLVLPKPEEKFSLWRWLRTTG